MRALSLRSVVAGLLAITASCHRYGMPRAIDDADTFVPRMQVALRDGSALELVDVVTTSDSVIGYTGSPPRVRKAVHRNAIESVRQWRTNDEATLVGIMIVFAVGLATLGYFAAGS